MASHHLLTKSTGAELAHSHPFRMTPRSARLVNSDEPAQLDAVPQTDYFNESLWCGVAVRLWFAEDQRAVQNPKATFVEVKADRPNTGFPWRQHLVREGTEFGVAPIRRNNSQARR